jgi:uncharacterized protein with GYD domain
LLPARPEAVRVQSQITLCNFTDQGIKSIKESAHRAEAFKAAAAKMGVTVREMSWTVGAYDLVVVSEGAEDAVMSAMLKVASAGNVRSQTLRAYSASEFTKLVSHI